MSTVTVVVLNPATTRRISLGPLRYVSFPITINVLRFAPLPGLKAPVKVTVLSPGTTAVAIPRPVLVNDAESPASTYPPCPTSGAKVTVA